MSYICPKPVSNLSTRYGVQYLIPMKIMTPMHEQVSTMNSVWIKVICTFRLDGKLTLVESIARWYCWNSVRDRSKNVK